MALTQTAAPNLGERLRCLAATTQSLLEQYELAAPQVHLIEDKQNTTYRVETAGGRERFFFRLTPTRVASSEELASELLWLRALDQNGIVVPTPVATRDGSWVSTTSAPAARVAPDSHIGALFRWLPGRQLDGSRLQPAEGERIGQLLAHLHRVGGGFEPGAELARPRRDAEQWFGTAEVIPTGLGEPLLDRQHRRILDETADVIRRRLSELGMDPEIYGLTHTDLEPDNLLLDGSRLYPIDFADCGWSYYLYDLAAALLPMASRPDFPQLKAAFVRGYQRVRRLPEAHLQDLDLFLVARGMFSMRLIVQHFWDDTRRRGYAERMFPYIMGEVRRFLIAHRRRPGSPGSPQRSDRETAHLTTVQLLDHLRQLGARVSSKGGRLKLNAPSGALTAELRRELGERKAEILEFLEHAKTAADSRRQQRIPRLQQRVEAPLSFAQNRLWLIHQLNPASSVYNIFAALRLRGGLHIDALRATLGALVARHESLRTTFAVSGRAEPRQRIAATQKLTLHQVDLETLVERDGTSRRIIEQTIRQPFDLERGPLLRVLLLRHTSREHMLVLSMHHIISDGWSIGILIRELSLLYRAFVERRPDPLPALEVQYADFASWQRHQLTGAALEAQLDYWRRQLEGAPSVLTLPNDRPRPRRQRDRGASRTRLLPPRLSDDLQLLAQRTDTTLFMVLLAAYQILL
ncbi:MAG: condensation domain-containing protein, partial [Acidobacteriota bacterium]